MLFTILCFKSNRGKAGFSITAQEKLGVSISPFCSVFPITCSSPENKSSPSHMYTSTVVFNWRLGLNSLYLILPYVWFLPSCAAGPAALNSYRLTKTHASAIQQTNKDTEGVQLNLLPLLLKLKLPVLVNLPTSVPAQAR